MPTPPPRARTPRLSAFLCAGLLLLTHLAGCDRPADPSELVVYCAHDAIYADAVLKDFERETGITIKARYDTEATKSLGLVQLIMRERDTPRCDVFWNNEQLGTMQLQKEGLLEPYKGDGYARIPDAFKDSDGHWTGFAARMRVWIVNTDWLGDKPADAEALWRLTQQGDLAHVAIAKPLYGTTRTHYTALWDHWGGDKLKAWHSDWRTRGVNEVAGNGNVMNIVATGACRFGLTDTDDYYVAVDAGEHVTAAPFRADDGRTIVIPNTVAIIKGTQRLETAKTLVDFLLSRKTELALARSKSRQIPLGPIGDEKLPDDIAKLKAWADRPYPLTSLGRAADETLHWLQSEYVK